jgi:hypothetical protein
LTYNSTIAIRLDPLSDVKNITRVTLIRYTTTTHSTNTDQRFLEPTIRFINDTHLFFKVPPNGGVAPPGNYHLFVLSAEGVPSVAKTVLIGKGPVVEVEVPVDVVKKPNAAERSVVVSVGVSVGFGAVVVASGLVGLF